MNKLAAVLILAGLLLAGLLCTGGNILAMGSDERRVEVSGVVRMVGNSPMNSLVITGEDREWYVEPDEQEKLMDLQQQTVTVKAREYYLDRVFANGTSAGRHYYLKNIVIINPKQKKK